MHLVETCICPDGTNWVFKMESRANVPGTSFPCRATLGTVEEDAAWFYPDTKEKAQHIKGYVAFCESRTPIKFHGMVSLFFVSKLVSD